MIRDNQTALNRIHVVLDAIVIALSYILAWYLKFRSGIFTYQISLTFNIYMRWLGYIVPAYLILYYFFNLYTPKRVQGRRLELANIIKANITGVLILIFILYLLKMEHFSRVMLLVFFVINIILEALMRGVIRLILRKIRKDGYNLKRILLIGYSKACEEFIDRVKQNPSWGYDIQGILDDNKARGYEYKEVKVIGDIDNLFIILPEHKLDEIVITLGLDEYGKLGNIVSACEKSGIHTKFVPDYNQIIPTKPYTEDLLGLPVVNIRHVPLNNFFNAFVKRLEDIVGSGICIVLFSPIMLVTALAIKISDPGPLIFKQERIGLHNHPFNMYKFRSMRVQTKEEEKKGWTTKDDPRVTKIGKFIRKTSIDELPQLFNIFKGDMSMIGPRPERPQFVEEFKEVIPRYNVKHQVRPGLTGWAQVNGYRGDTSIKKRVEYDLYYIENWSVGFDIKIIFLTAFKGFVNKNAY